MKSEPAQLDIYPRSRTVAVHTGDQFLWWCTRDKAGECEIKSVEVGSVMTAKKKEDGIKFMYRLVVLEFRPPAAPMPKAKPLCDPTERIRELNPTVAKIAPVQTPAPLPPKPSAPAKPLTQSEFGL